jgi:hypothetical protein
VRGADEFVVGQQRARALVAVVEEGVDAGGLSSA